MLILSNGKTLSKTKSQRQGRDGLHQTGRYFRNNWDLYVMLLFPLVYVLIFKYVPMAGVQMAFRDYSVFKGMWDSPWVGLEHFKTFFSSSEFGKLLTNTLTLSIYGLVAGMVFPVILALVLNYLQNLRFKKLVQTVTYAPYFISTTVMVSILTNLLAVDFGPVNMALKSLGLEQIQFMSSPGLFKHVYVWSGIWQFTGYNAIIYVATLSSVDPTLHEAAIIDGATKLRRVWSIDLPSIKSTIIILLIMNMGSVLTTGFEKIYLMQNSLNISASEVIDTYVYKIGLAFPIANYSYPTAIGLFQSLIGMVLIIGTNILARKVGEESLW